jgi:glucuronoarabinoxylan endo-1,4-beta-xylanase
MTTSSIRFDRQWIFLTLLGGLGMTLSGCVGRSSASADAGGSDVSESGTIVAPSELASSPIDGDQGTAKPAQVFVSFDRRFQVLEGFGASVAWYQDRIVGDTPKGLYEMLFPELGIDILRFRNRYDRTEPGDDKVEHEQEILERATKALGHPPRLLISSWSPPAALKASGRERCRDNKDCTLKKVDGNFVYDGFGEYWKKSLEHYATRGIVPEFISPQNEPDFIPGDWEGCRFDPSESKEYPGYDRALAAVHKHVNTLKTPPKILGPETLGIHYSKAQNFSAALDQKLLYGLAHHIYERGTDGIWDWRFPGPDSYVDEMKGVAEVTRLPLFQTEFMTDEDKGIEGGFETAWLMHNSLVEEGVAAFLYWDLIWNGASGLVGMNGRNPKVRDQYYSVRHFARFTDPGYQRIAAVAEGQGILVSAYIAPDEKQLTVVVLNTSSEPANLSVDPGGFAATKTQAFRTTYRPGKSQRWADLGANAGATTPVRMPSRSVATFVYTK